MLIVPLGGVAAAKTLTPLAVLAVFQAPDSDFTKLLMIFIGLVTLSMVVQGVVALAIGIGAIKAQKELTKQVLELKAKSLPLIAKSQSLIEEFTPQVQQIVGRVETIAAHVEYLTELTHRKADEIAPTISSANQTVQDANLKTRAQISRVNGMVTSTLDATVRLGVAIEQGIAKPSREIAGVLVGIRAGFDSLLRGVGRRR
jgi:hypothetical protein